MRRSRAQQPSNILRTRCDWRRRAPDSYTYYARYLLSHSRADEARAFLQSALELSPTDLTARELMKGAETRDAQKETLAGDALLRQAKFGEAIAQYETVLEIAPDFVSALNNFAWLLSTCPDASLRDGAKALELAKKADQLTDGKSPVFHSNIGRRLCREWPFQRGHRERATRVAARADPGKRGSGQEPG